MFFFHIPRIDNHRYDFSTRLSNNRNILKTRMLVSQNPFLMLKSENETKRFTCPSGTTVCNASPTPYTDLKPSLNSLTRAAISLRCRFPNCLDSGITPSSRSPRRGIRYSDRKGLFVVPCKCRTWTLCFCDRWQDSDATQNPLCPCHKSSPAAISS